jgi:hypothetical protein
MLIHPIGLLNQLLKVINQYGIVMIQQDKEFQQKPL